MVRGFDNSFGEACHHQQTERDLRIMYIMICTIDQKQYSGPIMLPWGTPDSTGKKLRIEERRLTHWEWLCR